MVVWGHFIEHTRTGDFNYYKDPMHTFIFSFHMPLFAAISGYLAYYSLKKRDAKAFLATSAKSYLIPIVGWTIISVILRFAVDRLITHKSVAFTLKMFVSAMFGNGYWFLWSVFGCAVCVLIAEKAMPKKNQWIFFLFGWAILYFLPNTERSLFLYPFYVVGFITHKYSLNTKAWFRKAKHVLSFTFIFLIWFYTEESYVYVTGTTPGRSGLPILEQIVIDIYRWIIGFCGIAFICILLDYASGIKQIKHVQGTIQDLGKCTLEIYVTQAIAVNYIYVMAVNRISWMSILSRGILNKTIVYDFITTPMLTVAFIAIDVWIIKRLKKYRMLSIALFGR